MSALADAVAAVADAIRAGADELNRLDGAAGDGDLGVTMTTAADAARAVCRELEAAAPADLLLGCGARIAREAPSTSGTLVASALLRAGRVAREHDTATAASAAALLEAALAGVVDRGKAEPGAKTMVDALVPAAQAAAAASARGEPFERALELAAEAADGGAAATAAMEPRHGRAGWLAERSAGHEDAGARLVAIVLASAAAQAREAAVAR